MRHAAGSVNICYKRRDLLEGESVKLIGLISRNSIWYHIFSISVTCDKVKAERAMCATAWWWPMWNVQRSKTKLKSKKNATIFNWCLSKHELAARCKPLRWWLRAWLFRLKCLYFVYNDWSAQSESHVQTISRLKREICLYTPSSNRRELIIFEE